MDNREPQPHPQEQERSVINSQEIDDLYDQTDRYFFARRDTIVVSPAVASGMLRESVETTPLAGRKLRVSRDRPSYVDDPTKVAEEAPLAMVDGEGKSVYHTPVDIEVVDEATGARIQRFTVIRSGPSDKGNEIPGLAQERDRALDDELQPGFTGTGGTITKVEFEDIMLRLQL